MHEPRFGSVTADPENAATEVVKSDFKISNLLFFKVKSKPLKDTVVFRGQISESFTNYTV